MLGMMPYTVRPGFARWLGYKGERQFAALYFFPDRPGPQGIACDDGVEVFGLADDEKHFMMGVVMFTGDWLRQYGFVVGYDQKATHWMVLDTQREVIFVTEKDTAQTWIETQVLPITEVVI